jgi:hypothetical protein
MGVASALGKHSCNRPTKNALQAITSLICLLAFLGLIHLQTHRKRAAVDMPDTRQSGQRFEGCRDGKELSNLKKNTPPFSGTAFVVPVCLFPEGAQIPANPNLTVARNSTTNGINLEMMVVINSECYTVCRHANLLALADNSGPSQGHLELCLDIPGLVSLSCLHRVALHNIASLAGRQSTGRQMLAYPFSSARFNPRR